MSNWRTGGYRGLFHGGHVVGMEFEFVPPDARAPGEEGDITPSWRMILSDDDYDYVEDPGLIMHLNRLYAQRFGSWPEGEPPDPLEGDDG